MEEVLTPVDVLKDYDIGAVTIRKLKKHGIVYLEDLLLYNPEELAERGIFRDEVLAKKVLHRARLALEDENKMERKIRKFRFFEEAYSKLEFFTTGIKKFDDILNGGIKLKDIYEFAGEFGSGKTQLAHQLCVTVQLPPSRGGLAGKAVYIDTEGTFRPERIRAIADRFEFPLDEIRENLYVFRPITVDDLEYRVYGELREIIKEGVKLVVIDSIIALYRAEFPGRGMLASRQQRINLLIDLLKRYASTYGLAVVYTNQVLSQPVPWGTTFKTPAGGNIIAHAATHRFFMKYSRGEGVIECFDSPSIPDGTTVKFKIEKGGLFDA